MNALRRRFAAALLAAPLVATALPALAQEDINPDPVDTTSASSTETAVSAAESNSPVSFGNPWMLLGLGGLPLIYWLVRTVPPAPRKVEFSTLKFLQDLDAPPNESGSISWWRFAMVAALYGGVVTALADPDLNFGGNPLDGEDAVMVVVDDGWLSAPNWDDRAAMLQTIISRAGDRKIMFMTTAPAEAEIPVVIHGPLAAADAGEIIAGLEPKPWPVDHEAALEVLAEAAIGGTDEVIWLSNGLDTEGTAAFAEALQGYGPVTVYADHPLDTPYKLLPPIAGNDALTVPVRRLHAGDEATVSLVARSDSGRVLPTQAQAHFAPGESETQAVFDVSPEERNRIMQISVEGEESAGATVLLDERWRRRPVGLVVTGTEQDQGSLAHDMIYVRQALEPHTDFDSGSLNEVLDTGPAVIAMTDSAHIEPAQEERLQDFVERGGLLLRFAGERTAQANDSLMPVRLRSESRVLGGAVSGGQELRLHDFTAESPYTNIEVPDDIVITQHFLPQRSDSGRVQIWAELDDRTPLVTAEQRGEGWVVLVHTNADRSSSNFVLSGAFVDMLRATVAFSQGVIGHPDGEDIVPPWKVLDAAGDLKPATPDTAVAVTADDLEQGVIGPLTPPGLYGDPDSGVWAHNLGAMLADQDFAARTALPGEMTTAFYQAHDQKIDVPKWLTVAAAALFLVYTGITAYQKGLVPGMGPGSSNRRRQENGGSQAKAEPRF